MMKNQTSKRRCLLQQINEVSFAVNDILLYLDTHPDDEKALAFFEDVSDRRNQLLAEYAKDYGPLTVDTASKTCETSWKWPSSHSRGKGKERDLLCGIMKSVCSIRLTSPRQTPNWHSSS